MERSEESYVDPIGSRPTGHSNPTLAPSTTGLRNPIPAPNMFGEPRDQRELGTGFSSPDSEVLVSVDDPSVVVSSDSATISYEYESFIDDNGDRCYRFAQQRDVVQDKKDVDEAELATNLRNNDVVQDAAGRQAASDGVSTAVMVDLIPAQRVPQADAMGTLSVPGKASPTDREF